MADAFYLPLPPSANNLFPTNKRTGRRFTSMQYKAWKQEAGYSLNAQRPDSVAGKAKVTYEFHRPDNRRRDVLNLEKCVSDLLVAHKLVADDCLIWEATIRWRQDRPGTVRVTLEPFDG